MQACISLKAKIMLQGLGMVDQEKYNLSKLCETRLSDLAGNMLGAELCTSRGVSKYRVVEPCGNIVFVSQWGVLFGGTGPEPYPAHLLPPPKPLEILVVSQKFRAMWPAVLSSLSTQLRFGTTVMLSALLSVLSHWKP